MKKNKTEEKVIIQSDAKIRDSIKDICIDPLNLNKHLPTILNMVYINSAVEPETQAMKQIESKRPEGLNEKISKVVEFMTDSENHVKVVDTNLDYSRKICLQANS